MLKITRIAGPIGSGKSHALVLIDEGMRVAGRAVQFYTGESTAKGIAQNFYGNPHTILIDDCSEQLIDNLRFELAGCDAYVIAAVNY